jgi:hypothetical protein
MQMFHLQLVFDSEVKKKMMGSSFLEILNQLSLWLSKCRWAEWKVLTIAIIALVLLLWIMRRQRRRTVRRVYEHQRHESSPVIGVNLGSGKRGHHGIENLKKGRLVSIHKRHQKQQPMKTKEPSEKLHEQIKQLQYEIIKRKQTEVRLEQQVAHLTAANEKLQLELTEKKQAETPAADEQFQHVVHDAKQVEQKTEQQAGEVQVADEQQQPKVSESKQVEQMSERQVITEPTIEKPVEGRAAGKGDKYDDLHRVVDGVKQKLCRKCEEWKPESEFHKNTSSKDGLAGSCKTCKANAAREYRKRRKAADG